MKKILAAIVAFTPSLALAHPGHSDNFFAAFAHPFTGIDHLLMMLCVGVFAGRIGEHARWQLPLAFLSAMTIGWVVAAKGFVFAEIESGIAAGLIALGVLFVWRRDISRAGQISIIAAFAFLHGMAHGAELSGAASIVAGGFLLATALLHAAGVCIAALVLREKHYAYRWLGMLLSLLGGGLLFAA